MNYKLKCIIVKCYQRDEDKNHETKAQIAKQCKSSLDYQQNNLAFLHSQEEYLKYIDKYGYHFNDALAEYASKMMKNANNQSHTWTVAQIKKSMENLSLVIPECITYGDATYLANMYYADLYPDVLKDEVSCIKAAYKIANDPDGYNGMIFCRWVTDIMSKAINIEWKKFI